VRSWTSNLASVGVIVSIAAATGCGSPSAAAAAGAGGGRGGRGGGGGGAVPVVLGRAVQKDVPVDLAAIGNVEAAMASRT
jgi:hypothetical protein